MCHSCEAWASGQFVPERLDIMFRSFCQGLDATIVQISYVADDLVARSRALCEKSETDALHISAKEKFVCNSPGH